RGERRGSAARHGDHVDLAADQIGRQSRQSIVTTVRPAIFDRHVLPRDVAGFTEALPEWRQVLFVLVSRPAIEDPDYRYRGLLRPRRNRPRRRATEQRDELAPSDHSITSSARASTVAGTSRPSALAVLRLITSSYLVGACTGRSAGFSPLR